MSEPRAPRPMWRPTSGWYAKRILGAATPVLLIAYWIADATGQADLPIWGFLVVFGIGVPLTVASYVRSHRAGTSRAAGFQALAAERGWTFVPFDPQFTTRWSTAPFGRGYGLEAREVAVGALDGMPCAAFTYSYTTGSGKDRRTTAYAVTTMMLPAMLPEITVTPESLVGEIVPGIVRADVDVESETFNRRYRVRTPYPKYASDVLPPRTIEALLSVEPFSWRIDGRDIVAWGPPTDDMDSVQARLEVLATVVRNIPQFVWRDASRPAF